MIRFDFELLLLLVFLSKKKQHHTDEYKFQLDEYILNEYYARLNVYYREYLVDI